MGSPSEAVLHPPGGRGGVWTRAMSAVAVLVVAGLVSAPLAAAKGSKPTVSGFAGNTAEVGVDGGQVLLSANISNASSCTLSAKGPSSAEPVSGLPATVACTGSTVSIGAVLPPSPGTKTVARSKPKAVSYKLTLTVTGAGGKVKAKTTLTVAAPPVNQTCQTESHNLVGCNLSYASLPGADLKLANMRNVSLSHTDLEGADFERALVYEARLEGANLEGANLAGVQSGLDTGAPSALPEHWQLTDGHLIGPGADLEGAHLEAAELAGADLEGAALEGADLEGADLEGAILAGVAGLIIGTPGALPEHWQLVNGHLAGPGADLEGVNLEGVDLEGADLEGAELRADLSGALLDDADLESARLEHANLRGADVEGANLKGANLEHSELSGSNLYDAIFTEAAVSYAEWGSGTTCPDGSNSGEDGETCKGHLG
jgi:uncharacterized protein YjbI with pentapeptide repeats